MIPHTGAMARPWKPLYFVPHRPIGEGLDVVEGIIESGRVVDRSSEYRLVWDSAVEQGRMDMRAHAGPNG